MYSAKSHRTGPGTWHATALLRVISLSKNFAALKKLCRLQKNTYCFPITFACGIVTYKLTPAVSKTRMFAAYRPAANFFAAYLSGVALLRRTFFGVYATNEGQWGSASLIYGCNVGTDQGGGRWEWEEMIKVGDIRVLWVHQGGSRERVLTWEYLLVRRLSSKWGAGRKCKPYIWL